MEDYDKDGDGKLAPDDSKFGGELADGVNRIRVGATDEEYLSRRSVGPFFTDFDTIKA